MTRSELINILKKKHPDLEENFVHRLVDLFFETIAEGLIAHKRIEIRGFGAFSIRKRAPRKARNPKNNVEVDLEERYTLYYRAGKELKALLNPS